MFRSGFFLDAFSANRVFEFAETLSFFLELLSFFLSYWDFFLSYWDFFLNLLKSGRFPLKDWLFLQYSSLKWGISAITVYFLFIWVNFCSYFSKILLKPWVFCLSFELFSWGLSFLGLEFFSNGPKKSLIYGESWNKGQDRQKMYFGSEF